MSKPDYKKIEANYGRQIRRRFQAAHKCWELNCELNGTKKPDEPKVEEYTNGT